MAKASTYEDASKATPLKALLMVPTVIWVCAFFIGPYLLLTYIGFKPTSDSAPYLPGFTLENYTDILTDGFYWTIFLKTLLRGALTALITLLLGYPVALSLVRGSKRLRNLLYVIVISPLLVGVVIRCYGWMVILADKGLINDTLISLGIISSPLPLMYNEFGTIVGFVQVYLPYMIIILTGTIAGINPELEKTARTLGATRWRAFREITLPLSLPGISSGTVLIFILCVSSYAIPMLLGGNRVLTTPLMVIQEILESFNWPGGSAMAVIMFVVVATILSLYIKLLSHAMRGLK